MTRKDVIMTDEAVSDLYELDYAIREKFQAPLSAARYLTGLKRKIKGLSHNAELRVKEDNLSRQHRRDIHRENYKKMAILYSFDEDKVYVHRIIPQSMVIY